MGACTNDGDVNLIDGSHFVFDDGRMLRKELEVEDDGGSGPIAGWCA